MSHEIDCGETVQQQPKAERFGNITSSGIVALVGMGKREMTDEEKAKRPKSGKGSATNYIEDVTKFSEAGLTYLRERALEKRLGLPLDNETNANETAWGNVAEMYMMNSSTAASKDLMSADYVQRPDESIFHPTIPYWCGRPDGQIPKKRLVCDIKSPYTRRSFCKLVEPIYQGLTGTEAMDAIRKGFKDSSGREHDKVDDGEKYYWQLVSNACLVGADVAELIIFMPYIHQTAEIRHLAGGYAQFERIAKIGERYLPYIHEGGYYKNKNVITFEVPQSDKDFLTERVKLAGQHLINL